VTGVHLTGHGITGKVVEHYRPVRNLQPEQRFELGNRMAACAQARWDEMLAAGQVKGNPPFNLTRKPKPLGDDAGDRKVPRHYLFNGWEEMSYRELAYTRQRIYNRAKQQPNVQIGEAVLVELSIDADAAPGDREIRLLGKADHQPDGVPGRHAAGDEGDRKQRPAPVGSSAACPAAGSAGGHQRPDPARRCRSHLLQRQGR
jgi:hypothetical protein